MKGFVICGILAMLLPFVWWTVYCLLETPKQPNIGLSLISCGSWLISEVFTVLGMIYFAKSNKELNDFFENL